MTPAFDPIPLLKRLVGEGVDFVVIGGWAVVAQGFVRPTRDLDIVFARDPANLAALGAVLTTLGATLRGADPSLPFVPDARTLRGVELLSLNTDLGALDVHVRPAGAPPYSALKRTADSYDLGGVRVRVACVPHLIAMKQAAGRRRDRDDVEALRAIEALNARSPG